MNTITSNKSKLLTSEQKEERRKQRQAEKEAAKEAARIEAEKNQKPVKEITFTIEWKKSRMWGSNPTLEAEVTFQDGSFERSPLFKASGCGYDKKSTVIANAFNHYLKYKLWAKSLSQLKREDYAWKEKDGAPYGVYGRDDYRYFDGGIGTNCYKAIAEYIGGKFENIASGKTFDVYKYTDLS